MGESQGKEKRATWPAIEAAELDMAGVKVVSQRGQVTGGQ